MQPFRVGIIGGMGFIGEYLIKKLGDNPKNSVNVFLNKTQPKTKIGGVEYFQIDENFENNLRDLDCLIILSQPNRKLIERIIGSSIRIKKIIYASTLLLYGNSRTPVDENFKIQPLNEYEKEKALEEKMLIDFSGRKDPLLTIARIANVYGDVKNRGVVQKIIMSVLHGEEFTVNNNGQQIRDYIFVEDVVNYLSYLVDRKPEERIEVFNICTGEGISIKQLISLVEDLTLKKIIHKDGSQAAEKESIIGDNRKIAEVSKMKPKYDIREGLKKTYRNYLKSI